jgi:uncharacterized protein YcbX
MATGTLTSLHRWPVKSMGGEQVATLRVDRRGAAGDRAHAVFDAFRGAPRRLTAREAPRLLAWRASYDGADHVPGPVRPATVTAPDRRIWSTADAGLAAALGADLGRPVALRGDAALMPDLPDSLLVVTQATLDAVRDAVGGPLDVRRFRSNLLVTLDAPAFAEEAWAGRTLCAGDVTLELLHPCERCVIPSRDPDTQAKRPDLLRWLHREHRGLFGINARATAPGVLRAGARVTVR